MHLAFFLAGMSPSEWKKGNIVSIHKKVTCKEIELSPFLYSRFMVKFLKDLFLTKPYIFSPLRTSSL